MDGYGRPFEICNGSRKMKDVGSIEASVGDGSFLRCYNMQCKRYQITKLNRHV